MAPPSSWTSICKYWGSSTLLLWSCEDISGPCTRLIGLWSMPLRPIFLPHQAR
jgi:hypothetical protein